MFLLDGAKSPAGRYRDMILQMQAGGVVPQIWHLFAFRAGHGALARFTQEVWGESPISPGCGADRGVSCGQRLPFE
jgi:hypothetical protein